MTATDAGTVDRPEVIDRPDLGAGMSAIATGRRPSSGAVASPYGETNLALHVGDDPEAVRRRRSATVVALHLGDEQQTPSLIVLRADHGIGVRVMTMDGADNNPEHYDAIVTDRSDVVAMAMAADCVPILLAAPDRGVVAAVHAGWRGAASGVVPAAVGAMTTLGAEPFDLRVYLGPAACGECYEVGDEVVAALTAGALPSGDDAAMSTWQRASSSGSSVVDLRNYLAAQLVALGVPASSIEVSSRCTIEDPALFSHRRDGGAGPTGRHAVVIGRRSHG